MKEYNAAQGIVMLIGRFLLAFIFLASTLQKLTNFSGTQAYMAAEGIPMTGFLLTGAIAFLLLGGFSVLLGYKARYGAWFLVIFLLVITPIFHNFWGVSPEESQGQLAHFMKNVAILGALLTITVNGAGPFSLDARAAKSQG